MTRKARIKNFMTTMVFILLITPFLSMSGIKDIMGASIYQAWQIASVGVMLFILIAKCAQIKVNWAIGLFGIYQLVILLSSTLNNGVSPGIITVVVALILIFTLFQTDLYYKMMSAICVIVAVVLLINFPIMLRNINTADANFFIGGKNTLGIFLTPGFFLLMLNSLEKHQKLTKFTLALVGLSLLTIFIGGSGTGIVVALCAIIFLLRTRKVKPKKTLYLGIIFLIYALFLIFSETFFLTDAWLEFTELLGKDSTLTSRTAIWASAMEEWKGSWLFGAGRGVEIFYVNMLGELKSVYESHNFVLEILLEGGVVALFLFGILFFKTVKHLNVNNVKHKVIFIALCVLLINGLTESTLNNFLVMIVLSIACRFANEQEKEEVRISNG